MLSMEEMQALRTTERRHMIGVKNAFAAGLALPPNSATDTTPFLLACTDYLEFILGRFHAQGRANTGRLRPLVGDNQDELQILTDIETMLGKSEREISKLMAAASRFGQDPAAEQNAFVDAGRHYVDFYHSVFAQRKDPAQQIIAKHFSDEDYWRLTNDFTDQSIDTERRLYARVKESAPPGVELD